jgi:hypothetical protein
MEGGVILPNGGLLSFSDTTLLSPRRIVHNVTVLRIPDLQRESNFFYEEWTENCWVFQSLYSLSCLGLQAKECLPNLQGSYILINLLGIGINYISSNGVEGTHLSFEELTRRDSDPVSIRTAIVWRRFS